MVGVVGSEFWGRWIREGQETRVASDPAKQEVFCSSLVG